MPMLPIPLPDEDLLGLIGRIRILRAQRDVETLFDVLDQELCRLNEPLVVGLARALEMDLADLVQQHTLLPLIQAVVPAPHGTRRHGSEDSLNLLRSYAFRRRRSWSRLCNECVREDVGYWGFAYFRRTHQIEGVGWCSKHGTALLRVEEPDPMSRLPSEYAELEVAQPERVTFEALSNPVVRRYAAICQAFLDRRHSLSAASVRNALLQKCLSFDQSAVRGGRTKLLVKLSGENLPAPWVAEVFPTREGSEGRGLFYNVFDSGNGAQSQIRAAAERYALAMALLFESPDEAMAAVTEATPLRIYGPTFWGSSCRLNDYLLARGSYSRMAQALSTTLASVAKAMDSWRLPDLTELEFSRGLEVVTDFASGGELGALADADGKAGEFVATFVRHAVRRQSPGIVGRATGRLTAAERSAELAGPS